MSMSDELKERNILKLILIVRFACATLDVGHPIARIKLAADQALLHRRPWTIDGTDALSWRAFTLPTVARSFSTERGACQRTPIPNDLHGNAKIEGKSASFAVGIFLEFSGTRYLPRRERRVKEFMAFVRGVLGSCFMIACK
jgi:hypothetical protein